MSEKYLSSPAALNQPIVYRGMTVNQLTEAYNDYKAIPNLDALLQKNREQAQTVKERLNPFHDIAYGPEPMQKLDIYAPKNKDRMPVLISIHGGGWAMGSKNPWSISAEILMSKGMISVSIDYGLAPQYRMEAILSHVRDAIRWVYKNIARYGGDPNRLYIQGVSAGAHLASTALMPNWQKDYSLPEDVIKGVIAMSGIYDLCTLIYAPESEPQQALQMTWEESQLYSPSYHLPSHPIPVIIAYGEKEPLILYHLEAMDYAHKLEKAGCHVSLIEVPGANHFDMINELAHKEGKVFEAVMKMIL
jgi:arylformamidase